MKITICGSMFFAKEMLEAKKCLEEIGHIVSIPSDTDDCVKNPELSMDISHCLKINVQEECFKSVAESDAILVLNYDRNGVKGYIGGATLMEIGLAQHFGKKIYLFQPPPKIEDQRYSIEVRLAKPIILNGNINRLR